MYIKGTEKESTACDTHITSTAEGNKFEKKLRAIKGRIFENMTQEVANIRFAAEKQLRREEAKQQIQSLKIYLKEALNEWKKVALPF